LFMQPMLFHPLKSRSAMSTVLGMLIFIGVLFTCVMPFFLYINQVNSLYDQTIIEMKQFDQERSLENIEVYAYPLNDTGNQISLYIKNQCPLTVEIVRIWVNDEFYSYTIQIPGMSWNITSPINVTLPQSNSTSFYVKVTTARGNGFSSLTNPLSYTAGSGWGGGGELSINVVISRNYNGKVTYNIKVTKVSDGSIVCDDDVTLIGNTRSYFKKIGIETPDIYDVTITKGTTLLREEQVEVSWENPTQWVYANDE